MENSKYVAFEILGVKKNGNKNSFIFDKDAECIITNDKYISKIQISSDISKAIFYIHDSLEILEDDVLEIVNYLSLYLGKMMVALLKNNVYYSNVLLKPSISISALHILENKVRLSDRTRITDCVTRCAILDNGNEILKKWIEDVEFSDYIRKDDKYDILFLLLQGKNIAQKYMAMYAYLMCLVKEIYSSPKERQKEVIQYISDNCSRVGINLNLTSTTRPGAPADEKEDQFTALRNKIAHPDTINANNNVNTNIGETIINELASIICCAIEDVPCVP